ncbi:AfsR/SARP family transcriptional regulator [Streptomyces zhaozhouensis]|uniref:AfsR/SARP family transcriptional regulator n=1 Tax=Streptomyces zhaozhouensis TaxID=1300267 RepID=UPI0014856939|nr:BTAD domain-containing putative transcriptional regulator [Streptomyces zhaozhouensis]
MSPDVLSARLLGPLEVTVGGRPVRLTGRQRALCAALLIDANHPVPVEQLVHRLWDARPPSAAGARLRSLVTEVRRALGARADALETRSPGYLLRVAPGRSDLAAFESLVAEGSRDAGRGDWPAAEERYDRALALWRGDPLPDLPAVPERRRLLELHTTAVEGRWEAAVERGERGAVVAELTRLAGEHPLRERPHALLMRALHAEGRTAEALEVYAALRRRLVDELAVEPSAELAAVQRGLLLPRPVAPSAPTPPASAPRAPTFLSSAPSSTAPEPPAARSLAEVPRQLPGVTPLFTGRDEEFRRLDAALAHGGRLIAVTGPAGAGKTAVALAWAGRVADRFPDGQLCLDLRGFDRSGPMPVAEALPVLLQGLGCPAARVPVTVEAQAALLRTLLADRRVLLVLDDAADAAQIRPLLPGPSRSVVLVTSRDRLSGLVTADGARRVVCEALPPADALALLGRTVGADRVAAEPEATARLARLCDHLPLALCVAASQLGERPATRVADYVEELAERGRLARLAVEGDAQLVVSAALDLTYAKLSDPARLVFRSLGAVGGTGRSAPAAAAGAGVERSVAEDALRGAVRVHLVTEAADGRFTWHDLVHEFAAQRLDEEESGERRAAATRRLLDHYLHGAQRAALACRLQSSRLPLDAPAPGARPPEFADRTEALAWIHREWEDLTAALTHAAEHGPGRPAWQLVVSLSDVMAHQLPLAEWLRLAGLALRAADRAGDRLGGVAVRLSLALAHWRATDLPAALAEYGLARELAREAEWSEGEGVALQGMGVATKQLGRPREALGYYRQALARFREAGLDADVAAALSNIGSAHLALGEPRLAGEALDAALPLARGGGKPHFHAMVLVNQGLVRLRLGRHAEALDVLDEALRAATEADLEYVRAVASETLAMVHADAGDHARARRAFTEALALAVAVENDNCRTACLVGLAETARVAGRLEEAGRRLDEARAIAARTGEATESTMVLLGEAELFLASGDAVGALSRVEEAEPVAAEGARFALTRLRLLRARALARQGAAAPAEEAARDALRLAERSGERAVAARVSRFLGELTGRDGRLTPSAGATGPAGSPPR